MGIGNPLPYTVYGIHNQKGFAYARKILDYHYYNMQ